MPLTTIEVEYIAELARLEISDNEKVHFQSQLSKIIEYASRLQQVNTSGIPATARISQSTTILQADDPLPGLDLDELLRNAPDTENHQFRVPPVLE